MGATRSRGQIGFLHQIPKQGIVFIQFRIIDIPIIQFFHQDFII